MPDAVWIALAAAATTAAVAVIATAVYFTARDILDEREARRRGGYLDLTSPDRERLGRTTNKPRRGSHRSGL